MKKFIVLLAIVAVSALWAVPARAMYLGNQDIEFGNLVLDAGYASARIENSRSEFKTSEFIDSIGLVGGFSGPANFCLEFNLVFEGGETKPDSLCLSLTDIYGEIKLPLVFKTLAPGLYKAKLKLRNLDWSIVQEKVYDCGFAVNKGGPRHIYCEYIATGVTFAHEGEEPYLLTPRVKNGFTSEHYLATSFTLRNTRNVGRMRVRELLICDGQKTRQFKTLYRPGFEFQFWTPEYIEHGRLSKGMWTRRMVFNVNESRNAAGNLIWLRLPGTNDWKFEVK